MNVDKFFNLATKLSIPALIVGFAFGLITKKFDNSTFTHGINFLESITSAWIFIVQFSILPLIVFQLFHIIIKEYTVGLGKWGAQLLGIYFFLVVVGTILGIFGGFLLLPFAPMDVFSGSSEYLVPAEVGQMPEIFGNEFWIWLKNFFISNPLNSVYESSFIPLIVFSVIIAILLRKFAGKYRSKLATFSQNGYELAFKFLKYILLFLPIGVLVLSQSFTRNLGLEFSMIILKYIGFMILLLMAYFFFLYPIMKYFSGLSYKVLQSSLTESQILALGSRSSLATVPTLLKGAKEKLKLPDAISSFSIPLSATLLKVNRPINNIFRYLFIMQMSGLEITWTSLLGFTFFTILFIPLNVGIPSGSGVYQSLPLYVSFGAPAAGYILIKSAADIVDLIKTLVNTTGYMAATVLLFGLNKNSDLSDDSKEIP